MDGRGFILCLVFPFRGRLPPRRSGSSTFSSREKRVFFFTLPPSTRKLWTEGYAIEVGRLQRKRGSYTRPIDIWVENQSGFLLRPLLDTTRFSILFARIDFDWYSRRLRASTPSVINHCETRQGNALSRPVETSRSPNFCKLHPSDISLPL